MFLVSVTVILALQKSYLEKKYINEDNINLEIIKTYSHKEFISNEDIDKHMDYLDKSQSSFRYNKDKAEVENEKIDIFLIPLNRINYSGNNCKVYLKLAELYRSGTENTLKDINKSSYNALKTLECVSKKGFLETNIYIEKNFLGKKIEDINFSEILPKMQKNLENAKYAYELNQTETIEWADSFSKNFPSVWNRYH